ncbi:aspartyl-tRNA synthetase 2, mitochondrial [Bulinus truncatus]|nr:aspartyl-tRNA synthetase 2, mitochondrial [Bulinus truncatus]
MRGLPSNLLSYFHRLLFRPNRYLNISNSAVSFTKRSHLCGELRAHHAGESVTLCGWLQFHRLNGAFIVLRDWCGSVQLILPKSKIEEYKSLPLESVLEVKGTVSLRPQGLENKKMATGCVEINVTDLKLLNGCTSSLPFEVQSFNQVKESLRIKHRYLELRLPHLQKVLRLRSDFVMAVRHFLANKNGFVEVETPTLFRRTPGGAREFVVPTHTPGKFYSLPQSPQQFKQLLMVGALDRYFQIARCYRDEGTKPDRQPEFTQIDLEMSFVDQRAVMDVIEQMLLEAWPGECGPISAPFPRMPYQEVMTSYGIDKPDLRFDWKIVQMKAEHFETVPAVFQNFLTNEGMSLQVLRIPQGSKHLSNKELEDIKVISTLKVKDDSGRLYQCKIKEDGSWSSGLSRHIGGVSRQRIHEMLGAEPHDFLFFAGGSKFNPHSVLGQIRLNAADMLESKGVSVREEGFKFLWVDNFPLFLHKENGDEGLESAHHPFTAPLPEDLHLIYSDPELVRGQHYDLVLNGSEIGGGSIRIHDSKLQRFVLTDVLKEDSSELEHLLFALDCGAPPHGGIALGLDRLMAIMCGKDSIRDVIAFPKIMGGKDPLSDSPASISQSDMDYYHIKLNIPEQNGNS